jgi:hypothetical protein
MGHAAVITRRHVARVLALLLAVALVGLFPLTAEAAKRVFTIRDPRITESSGLARDVIGQNYWTINDSGDEGVAYALSTTGKVLGRLTYQASPVDVEGLALENNRLWIGDIGDNRGTRSKITVYYFDNPAPTVGVRSYRSYDFTYPDGPHDAEALLVSPRNRVYIVTKGLQGAVYRAPRVLSADRPNRLKRIADAPRFVTDGTFLPGGKEIALRTYVSVVVIDIDTWKTVAQAPTPTQPQGESMTLDLAGDALLVGSEGRRSKVYEMPIPTKKADVPSASATPPAKSPSPSPSPSASAQDPGEDPGDDAPDDAGTPVSNREGTWVAIGLAALVAVTSGVVVAATRKR